MYIHYNLYFLTKNNTKFGFVCSFLDNSIYSEMPKGSFYFLLQRLKNEVRGRHFDHTKLSLWAIPRQNHFVVIGILSQTHTIYLAGPCGKLRVVQKHWLHYHWWNTVFTLKSYANTSNVSRIALEYPWAMELPSHTNEFLHPFLHHMHCLSRDV